MSKAGHKYPTNAGLTRQNADYHLLSPLMDVAVKASTACYAQTYHLKNAGKETQSEASNSRDNGWEPRQPYSHPKGTTNTHMLSPRANWPVLIRIHFRV